MHRRVTVAFVGSGGAARGLAHLGVLKACEELGIRPEIFVGASAGAIVAATYGQGMGLDVLLDGYRLPWKRRHSGPKLHASTFFGLPNREELAEPGRLLSGAFSIDRLERHLRAALPNNDFSRLVHPLLVTAVDIDRARREVFGPGYREDVPISQAVAASCCVPGLFRPYRIGDGYYLDGEVVKTLSADLAIEAGADVVIISSIYAPEVTRQGRRSIAAQGAARVLTQTVNILLTQKEHTGVQLHARNNPHVNFLNIEPEIGHLSYFNRFAARSLVMRGYHAALRVLVEARAHGIFGEPGEAEGLEPVN